MARRPPLASHHDALIPENYSDLGHRVGINGQPKRVRTVTRGKAGSLNAPDRGASPEAETPALGRGRTAI